MSLRAKIENGLGVILALAMWSCENPNEIGITELPPDTSKVKVYYKEFILPASVIQNDSILTAYSKRLLCGNYHDEFVGSVHAETFTQVLYVNNPPVISSSAEFDSLKLTLYANYAFGPGTEVNQRYFIHQLSKPLQDSIPYFTTSSLLYNPDPIGTGSFTVLYVADTAMNIMLDPAFGQKLLDDLIDTTLFDHKSGKAFNNYFKGIAIIADPSNNSIIGFDPASTQTAMTLYYHIDTLSYYYVFNMALGVNFNRIIPDRTGTALQGIGDMNYTEFMPTDQRAYLQAGVQLITKINLKPALDFLDSLPNIVINKATLEVINHAVLQNVTPPSSLFFYCTDSTNRRIGSSLSYIGLYTDDKSGLVNPAFDNALNGYSASITQYVEEYINGLFPINKVLIYPDASSLSQTVNELIIEPQNIKLKIYYTALSE